MVLVPAEISVPVSCDFSLSSRLSPILGSSLPCDLDFLMDLRVIDLQFVQLFSFCVNGSGGIQVPYVPDQETRSPDICF